jgi:NAD(P)-dependent dehydrogenase (short-subunit alcohol dehydrogenase family)
MTNVGGPKLEGHVAPITGGARGIGATTARRLAEDGAAVGITDVLDAEATAVADELSASGQRALFAHLDVTDEEAWGAVADRIEAKLGPLTILVNNAGIGTFADVEEETRDAGDRLIAINQTGVWLGMKVVGRRMRERGRGSIVNVSSIFGAVSGFGGSIAYHASKGAVRLVTKSAALHWATSGDRVNSIHPRWIGSRWTATRSTPWPSGARHPAAVLTGRIQQAVAAPPVLSGWEFSGPGDG